MVEMSETVLFLSVGPYLLACLFLLALKKQNITRIDTFMSMLFAIILVFIYLLMPNAEGFSTDPNLYLMLMFVKALIVTIGFFNVNKHIETLLYRYVLFALWIIGVEFRLFTMLDILVFYALLFGVGALKKKWAVKKEGQ